MSKTFTNIDPYEADTDQMWAMITSKDYWNAKYEALGATNVSWVEFSASADSFSYTSERDIPAELPSFAKKIVGDTSRITQTERWTKTGGSAAATIEIQVKNVPGGTNGTMEIESLDGGSQWSADFEIKVSIPLVGGKLEGVMHEQTGLQFKEEKAFNDRWLAGEV